MKTKLLLFVLALFCSVTVTFSQSIYSTTGLLRMPTADMQQDKTVMIGGSVVDHRTLSGYWANHQEYNPFTFDYYVNVTFFPWLEISYMCTLVKGVNGSTYWPRKTWGKFTNQDRSFHGRLRLWKEGWWKAWTPQIVFGANDPGSHSYNGGGEINWGGGQSGNHNYLTRYYLAATKHLSIKNTGILGLHAAFLINRGMSDVRYNRPAVGANFQLALPSESSFLNKALNGLNLMAEVCPGHDSSLANAAYNINVGAGYTFWRDHVNLIAELYDGKYFSGGVQFKVHLK